MATKQRITHAVAVWGAIVLGAAVPAPGSAQQLDKSAPAAKPVQGAATRPAAKPAKSVQRAGTSQNLRPTEAQSQEWKLEDAMPDHSASMRYYAPDPPKELGRVPLQTGPGSFGLTTDNMVKSNQLPDGRPIPSIESASRKSPSYVGLSLSVPTSDKSLYIPVPFGPSW